MKLKIITPVVFCFIALISWAQEDPVKIIKDIEQFQIDENNHYRDVEKSPLRFEMANVAEFEGHPFFPANLDFYVVANFKKVKKKKKFKMKTSTDRLPKYYTYGIATFEIKGKEFQLSLYRAVSSDKEKGNDNLFLAYKDLTSGEESYGGGRYINLKMPKGDKIIIDFNKSYNPYCAYSSRFSCPIPPSENFLDIPIKAGVKYIDKH